MEHRKHVRIAVAINPLLRQHSFVAGRVIDSYQIRPAQPFYAHHGDILLAPPS
jgi:hypothetical protein